MMHPRRAWLAPAAVAWLCLASAALAASPVSVPLTLRSAADRALVAAPFSAGVPLPPGAWQDGNQVDLVDGERRVPVQVRVLGRWPDASARWLLADWQASLAAGEARPVRLEVGAPPAVRADSPMRVLTQGERIRIETGAAVFVVPRSGADVLAALDADGNSVATLQGFATFGDEGDRRVEVAESGIWRARVVVETTRGRMRFRWRIDFFAGRRDVRILHTIENHDPSPDFALGEFGVVVRRQEPLTRLRFGLDDGSVVAREVGTGAGRVAHADAATLRVDGAVRPGRASGWFHGDGGGRGTAIAARFFREEYPQAVDVRGNELRYFLRADDGRPLPFGSGAAKTHEFALLLDGTAAEAEALAALRSPPLAWIDPGFVRATGALRNALGRDPASAPFLDRLVQSIEAYVVAQEREEWDDSRSVRCSEGDAYRRRGAFGMLNWGDWNFRGFRDDIKGCDAWGNLEYDTAQVLALAWVATGEPRYFELATAAARHFGDVDTIHFHPARRDWVGMNHPKNPLHFTWELGGVDLGHTWNEGLFSYGFLAGDERALAAARGIADYLVRRRTAGVGFRGNPRQWGWPQVALVAAWENTGDERYREAALWYGQRGILGRKPDDLGQWKTGILAEALAYTHAATGDELLRRWLEAYAAAVVAARPADPRFYPALAYIGGVAGRDEWRSAARDVVARLQLGRWGKPMTIGGRIGLSSLYWLDPPTRKPR